MSVNNAAPSLEVASFSAGGLFRSTNNGASWVQVMSGHFTDIVSIYRPESVRTSEWSAASVLTQPTEHDDTARRRTLCGRLSQR